MVESPAGYDGIAHIDAIKTDKNDKARQPKKKTHVSFFYKINANEQQQRHGTCCDCCKDRGTLKAIFTALKAFAP